MTLWDLPLDGERSPMVKSKTVNLISQMLRRCYAILEWLSENRRLVRAGKRQIGGCHRSRVPQRGKRK